MIAQDAIGGASAFHCFGVVTAGDVEQAALVAPDAWMSEILETGPSPGGERIRVFGEADASAAGAWVLSRRSTFAL